MDFLTIEDMIGMIRSNRLDQITDEDDALVNDAINDAVAMVNNYLFQHFDTDQIFSQEGEQKDRKVTRWCKYLAIYYIYDRIEDELIPERVQKNYEHTMKTLEKIAQAKMPVDLPRRADKTPTETRTRWGSEPKRSH